MAIRSTNRLRLFMQSLEISIDGIIEAAQRIQGRVANQLPGHSGLAGAIDHVVGAAQTARDLTVKMKRPFSLHRMPIYFLGLALLLLCFWLYWSFVHESTLTIAMAQRDTQDVQRVLAKSGRVRLQPIYVRGSKEAVTLVQSGQVDLAVVEGGIAIPDELPRMRTPSDEWVLWLTRDPDAPLSDIRRVITSLEGAGSHAVAKIFFESWGRSDIAYSHTWADWTERRPPTQAAGQSELEADAVFVVKDTSDAATIQGIRNLVANGFHLRSPSLGAQAEDLAFLKPAKMEPGYLWQNPNLPIEPIATYVIPSYLVARSNLTPRLMGLAGHLFDSEFNDIHDNEFAATAKDASEVFQGVDAFLGILINIGLAFLALVGLDMLTYRKRFHELNSLVSLLSMLQSNKDVLGESDPSKLRENLLYLSSVSDVLSIISAISGYYTQQNSSLLFNNLSQIVHERCDNLKLNIQMKILHAGIRTDAMPANPTPIL